MVRTRAVTVISNERAAFVGRTGSGKTFFAREILRPLSRVIVLDPKGTLTTPDWNLSDSGEIVRRLRAGKSGRLRVPAPFDGNWEPWLALAWEIGNVTVYIDEVYGVVEPGRKPPALFTALYTRGREAGIGVFAATQRPAWVPLFVLSEANWLFVFRLSLEDDRKRMMQFGDDTGMLGRPIRDPHGFYTYNPNWNGPPIYTPRYALANQGRTVVRQPKDVPSTVRTAPRPSLIAGKAR